jgi:hypothetical protein
MVAPTARIRCLFEFSSHGFAIFVAFGKDAVLPCRGSARHSVWVACPAQVTLPRIAGPRGTLVVPGALRFTGSASLLITQLAAPTL